MPTLTVEKHAVPSIPPLPAVSPEAAALLAVLLEPAQPGRMTYEEFLAWADEDTLAEWVDGEIIMTSPASLQHQSTSGFLFQLLSMFVETRQLGVVITAPYQMKLARSGREPDLLFVAGDHLHRLRPTYLDGPADLAVEIISPESVGRDRGEKFTEYEAGGVADAKRGCWTRSAVGPSSITWRASATGWPSPAPRAHTARLSCPASGCASNGSGSSPCHPCWTSCASWD